MLQMRATERGFSLVETIVSIGLLTSAFITFAYVMAISTNTNEMARHRTRSAIFAQETMERLRAEGTLSDASGAVEYLDASGGAVCSGAEACGAAVYIRRWSLGQVAIAPSAVLVQVQVRHVRGDYGEVHLVTVRPRTLR